LKVIILAAGLGSRLGELGKNLPKGMITIFGKTLIERQIEIFHNCGINDITIITGHNSEVIKYTNVDYIKNPNYATTNMNESLFCAKQKFDDSILVSYADIIFEQRTIEEILRFRQDVGVAINLDWKKNYENRTQHPLSEAENVLIENFQGERAPRISPIKGATKVTVKGDDVIITGPVLTDVSQTAANIQLKSKVKNKDHRVFLDGIYRFSKSKGIEK